MVKWLLAATACLVAGCIPMVGLTEMGPALDKMLGKPMPQSQYPVDWDFIRREVDGETYELVSRRTDECNYVLTVRTADRVVVKWRFLSLTPPKACHFQRVRQLM